MPAPAATSQPAVPGTAAHRRWLPGLYGFVVAVAALLLWCTIRWPYVMEVAYATHFGVMTGLMMARGGTAGSIWTGPALWIGAVIAGAVIAGAVMGRVRSLLIAS